MFFQTFEILGQQCRVFDPPDVSVGTSIFADHRGISLPQTN
jgi:hypothetical protein